MKQFFLFLALFSIILLLFVLISNSLDLFPSLVQHYSLLGSLAIQMFIFFTALFFLWKKDLRSTLHSIGFPGSPINTVIFTIVGLLLMFLLLVVLGVLATFGGFNDQEKISDKVASLPLVVLLFAVLLAPIGEELFFRALLVPRFDNFFLKLIKIPHLGIFFSSVVFSISHFAYGSIVEILGVFVIGILLAVIFKASKSITPCIVIHMIYNGISILAMKLLE
ncbi:MAG: type II CAAX endopeptidase family protein [Candidatus Micrarchaeota archaeon]